MTAKELRLDNWVKSSEGKPMQVQIIGRVNHVNPIPLTPEWLEKLGFDSDEHHKNSVCWSYNGFMHLEIMPIENPTSNWAILSVRHSGDETGRINLREVQYVHQLQNLYFALTGEELTIEEND